MALPDQTNPHFLRWLEGQPKAVQDAVNDRWDNPPPEARVFAGHKSAEYARLKFLMDHCALLYGYRPE